MTTLVLKMSISLDGYVAPADRSEGWAAAGRSPDGAEWTLDTVSNARMHVIRCRHVRGVGRLLAHR